ncbi:acetolactate synthase small subunit [Enterococcus ureilyticus]|uniref:Acetolactate synthase small subunit n=1 Tax=Enterococcus ureilyticus TaxID=1131292 RepID=A0A1E5HDF4_9ENTE|nr:acetolactate synthase small subunit [Enterococcus ureilyticus]MBM7690027.1 acetolactate synthase-1/3 small subunit [Enterococcus ureilyticus]MBO0445923.1 acetolactate synthase small subunit [Enterococcus ureilyticus]OEG22979.1 acetolactate synthase small subunit [Enterococcus ureilyticus]
MRRIITATVNNNSGVLNRFSGVLTRRQVNIDSISVGATELENVSRITIIVQVADLNEAEQVTKQLNKQIDVIKVSDITDEPHLERELALVKLNAPATVRAELFSVIDPFRANVIDVGTRTVVIQVTGTSEKISAFVDVVAPYGIKQLARTGVTGFTRGNN